MQQARALEGIGESQQATGQPDGGLTCLHRSLLLHEQLGDAELPRVRARVAAVEVAQGFDAVERCVAC